MKTILPIIILFALWIWQAHSSGAAREQDKDRTGSPVADGFCGNCHTGGDFGTTLNLSLHDENGDTVTTYRAGDTYEVRVKVAADGASGFGFQAVALAEDLSDAGAFGVPSAGTQVITVAERDYFEHSMRSAEGEWSIDWTAPDAGGGDLKFYFAGNAVNGDGDRSGDLPINDSLLIAEDVLSSSSDVALLGITIVPNPFREHAQISWNNDSNVTEVSVFDMHGKVIQDINVPPGSTYLDIDFSSVSPGILQVVILSDQGIEARKLLKLQ